MLMLDAIAYRIVDTCSWISKLCFFFFSFSFHCKLVQSQLQLSFLNINWEKSIFLSIPVVVKSKAILNQFGNMCARTAQCKRTSFYIIFLRKFVRIETWKPYKWLSWTMQLRIEYNDNSM